MPTGMVTQVCMTILLYGVGMGRDAVPLDLEVSAFYTDCCYCDSCVYVLCIMVTVVYVLITPCVVT